MPNSTLSGAIAPLQAFESPCQRRVTELVMDFPLAEIMLHLEEQALFKLNRRISCHEFYGNADNLCLWDVSGATDQPDERDLW